MAGAARSGRVAVRLGEISGRGADDVNFRVTLESNHSPRQGAAEHSPACERWDLIERNAVQAPVGATEHARITRQWRGECNSLSPLRGFGLGMGDVVDPAVARWAMLCRPLRGLGRTSGPDTHQRANRRNLIAKLSPASTVRRTQLRCVRIEQPAPGERSSCDGVLPDCARRPRLERPAID